MSYTNVLKRSVVFVDVNSVDFCDSSKRILFCDLTEDGVLLVQTVDSIFTECDEKVGGV